MPAWSVFAAVYALGGSRITLRHVVRWLEHHEPAHDRSPITIARALRELCRRRVLQIEGTSPLLRRLQW